MKYCKNCGSQIEDEAVVCVSCGCSTATQPAKSETSSTLKLIAKIFMILGCIAFGWTFDSSLLDGTYDCTLLEGL